MDRAASRRARRRAWGPTAGRWAMLWATSGWGCGDTAASAPSEAPEAPADGPGANDAARGTDPSSTPGAGPPLPRAIVPLGIAATSGPAPEGDPSKLQGWYALEGTVGVPAWAVVSQSAPSARDDDLATSWTCLPTTSEPCGLGLAFPRAARVQALRLRGPLSAGVEGGEALQVRVHTDLGFVDVGWAGGPDATYVVFPQPITTRTIVLDIPRDRQGRHAGRVRLAELQAFGVEGVPRPPIATGSSIAVVRFADEAWRGAEGAHGYASDPALGLLRPDGDITWIAQATAVFGRSDDRYLLLERLRHSDCDRVEGEYTLLDRQTRVLFPLGSMDAPGGVVHRHPEGRGFAVRGERADGTTLVAIVDEPNHGLRVRRPQAGGPSRPDAVLQAWGFDPEVTEIRGGDLVPDLPAGCVSGRDRPEVLRATGVGDLANAAAIVCPIADTHLAVVVGDDGCAKNWTVSLLDRGLRVLDEHRRDDEDGRGLRIAPFPEGGWVIEGSRHGGRGADLFRIDASGIRTAAASASLALRSPAACDPCFDHVEHPPSVGAGHVVFVDAP